MNGERKIEEEFYARHRQSSGMSRHYNHRRARARRVAEGAKR